MLRVLLALLISLSVATATDIKVYFSPKGGCTEAIVASLRTATNAVLVQAYSFFIRADCQRPS